MGDARPPSWQRRGTCESGRRRRGGSSVTLRDRRRSACAKAFCPDARGAQEFRCTPLGHTPHAEAQFFLRAVHGWYARAIGLQFGHRRGFARAWPKRSLGGSNSRP